MTRLGLNASFPNTRLRRLRQAEWSRALVQEHHLSVDNLIQPLFVMEGQGVNEPIATMPNIMRYSIDTLVKEVKALAKLGIPAVAIFPVVDKSLKDKQGSEALNINNLICRAINAVKQAVPEIGVIGDVALDPYTTHGHDGVLGKKGEVDNDATLTILCEQAMTLVRSGCNILAPSDMMDGRVGAIRQRLEQEGCVNTLILSYAAKYASALYAPFRDAIGSAGQLGKANKATYQMQRENSREALAEVALDIQEGADIVMVKPAMMYLDIILNIKNNFMIPVFGYQVSGEYAMLMYAAQHGGMDKDTLLMESLVACKRAGANAVLTYGAKEAALILQGG